MKTLSAPLDVCLGITNQCNLNCKHCFALNTRNNEELTTEELLQVIKQIEEMKIFNVAIFGGEPLVREDFFIILEALSKLKIRLSLNTNGTLITPDIAKKLKGYPIRTYTVSLDGSCPEVQDPFRGKGSFEKNIVGIRNLIREGCNVLIATTVTQYNYRDAENIVLLGKSLGAGHVRLNEVVYMGNAACYNRELLMSPQEKLEFIAVMRMLLKKWGSFITGSIPHMVELMDQAAKEPLETFPLRLGGCRAATKMCNIRPDGWVTPCEVLWYLKAGNVREKSLSDIWLHSPVMESFRKIITINELDTPECKGCQYLRLCYKGRCQPYYNPGKKFTHKEFYCWRQEIVAVQDAHE